MRKKIYRLALSSYFYCLPNIIRTMSDMFDQAKRDAEDVQTQINAVESRSGNRATAREKSTRNRLIENLIKKMAKLVSKVNDVVASLNELRVEIGESEIRYCATSKLLFVKLTLKSLLINAFSLSRVAERTWMVSSVRDLITNWLDEFVTLLSLIESTTSLAKKFVVGQKEMLVEADAKNTYQADELATLKAKIQSRDAAIKDIEKFVVGLEGELENANIMQEVFKISVTDDDGTSDEEESVAFATALASSEQETAEEATAKETD